MGLAGIQSLKASTFAFHILFRAFFVKEFLACKRLCSKVRSFLAVNFSPYPFDAAATLNPFPLSLIEIKKSYHQIQKQSRFSPSRVTCLYHALQRFRPVAVSAMREFPCWPGFSFEQLMLYAIETATAPGAGASIEHLFQMSSGIHSIVILQRFTKQVAKWTDKIFVFQHLYRSCLLKPVLNSTY